MTSSSRALEGQMNGPKGLVLDANILIRAAFGRRVREILEFYENVARFCSPDVCVRLKRPQSELQIKSF